MENTGSHGPDPTLYHHHPVIHFISRNTNARHLVDSGTSYCALGCHVSRCLWLVALPTHLSHLMTELLTILCLVFDLITEFLAKFISGQLLPAVFLYWLLVKNKVFFVLLFPTLSGHAVWKICVLLRWGNIKKVALLLVLWIYPNGRLLWNRLWLNVFFRNGLRWLYLHFPAWDCATWCHVDKVQTF